MKQEKVTLRCDDGAEAVVFTKYNFRTMCCNPDESGIRDDFSYEICIEDDYVGGEYKGFFGRIKRAWRAFWDKPVVYTGIYTEDKDKMIKFLRNCLDLIIKDDAEQLKTMYDQMNGNASTNTAEM